eukprot:EG_transcript_11395
MLPDDANPAGNVHGGTTLRMIEQAGFVVATRLCNRPTDKPHPPLMGSLVQIYQMSFIQPMHVGDLARLTATPTFTSNRSIEVQVDVWADNLMTGEVRHTNHAVLNYAAVDAATGATIDFVIPQLVPTTPEEQALFDAGRERYQQRLTSQQKVNPSPVSPSPTPVIVPGPQPTGDSAISLVQMMLPGDCHHSNVVGGGVILKLMDNAAAVCAVKHCQSNVVTVSIDTLVFLSRLRIGDVAYAKARVVFTSARTMDIQVEVEVERFGVEHPIRTTQGVFAFASLDPTGRPQAIPPLRPQTSEAVALFEVRQQKYEERKRAREKSKAAPAQAEPTGPPAAAAAPSP